MITPKRASRAKKVAPQEIENALAANYSKLDFKFRQRDYKFTQKQKSLISAISNPELKIIFIDGDAGTSKSLVSIYCALTALKEETAKKVLYMRSVVESNQKGLGFLKGDLSEKMAIWRHVLDSKCEELVEPADLPKLLASGKLEALPINYIRGASWKDMFVVIDEAQNLDYEAFKLVMSRIGENTTLILCGDSDQSDIHNSGFKHVYNMFNDDASANMGIFSFKFEEEDIVRSEICKFVVKKFRVDQQLK